MTLSLSVVTPSYNQGRFIERTIRSVLSQQTPASEYVVFDGGSTDETLQVLRSFGDQIKWVSEADRGQTDAVNKGIRSTRGEIIGWLNSDDIYYPGAFSRVLDFFTAHPEVDVVYGKSNHIGVDDEVIEPYPTEPWSLERLKENCYISQPAVFFRRRAVERWGLLNDKLNFCMDYEFWLRLGLGGANFAYLPHVLAATRIYPETKTIACRLKCGHEINEMLADKLGSVPDFWIFQYARSSVADRGITRKQPVRFATSLLGALYASSIKWNSGIRWGLIQTVWRRMLMQIRPAVGGQS